MASKSKSTKRLLSDGDNEDSPKQSQPSNKRAKVDSDDLNSSMMSLDDSMNTTLTTLASSSDGPTSQNVRVVARLRPLSTKERNEQSEETLKAELSSIVVDKNRSFEYDAVFDPSVSQEQLYAQTAGDTVKSNIFKGFNVTILAYGQTGSGKTYTMGNSAKSDCDDEDSADKTFLPPSEGDGVIPRAVYDLFQTRNEMKQGKERVKVEMSYLEIYNEEARDLFCSDPTIASNLHIRDSSTEGVYVQNLTWKEVKSPDQVTKMMEAAAKRRATASTQMNAVSSRSHAICTLNVTVAPLPDDQEEEGNESASNREEIRAKLTLVDLAGSERLKRTGAEGSRLKEGININKGLFVLGQVVSSLSELGQQGTNGNTHTHVPYRDSKLTRLLQDSLGGNSRTIMVACISPADSNVEESINTLRYAQRARNIKNSAVRNVVVNDMSATEAAAIRRENQMLKLQIFQLTAKVNGRLSSTTTGTDASEVTRPVSGSSSTSDDVTIDSAGLDIGKLEIVKRMRAKCTSMSTKIEQLEEEKISAAEDVLATSLRADILQVKLEELSAVAKSQGVNLPTEFTVNAESCKLAERLRNEAAELKSQLQNALSDAAIARATAAAIIAGDGSLSAAEEMALASAEVGSLDEEGDDNHENSTADCGDGGKLAAELIAVGGEIEQKEAMAMQMNKERELQEVMQSHFEGALKSLQEEVDALMTERETLLAKASQKQSTNDAEPSDATRTRVKELESRINELKSKGAEHTRSLRMRELAEKKCAQLASEIQADKKRRTALQRKLKEASEERRSEKKAAQLHAVRMLRDSQKLKCELQKVKDAAARQAAVLRRKAAEAVSRQKKTAELQRKRNAAASMRSKASSNKRDRESLEDARNEDLVAWLEREVEASLTRKHTVEQLEEQKLLLEDAIERRTRLNDGSSGSGSASMRTLDNEVDMRTGIVKQLEKNVHELEKCFDTSGSNPVEAHRFQDGTTWNNLSRSDVKSAFSVAFERLVVLQSELDKAKSHHSDIVAKASSKAAAHEKKITDELIMKLKVEHSEDIATLLQSTQSTIQFEVRSNLQQGDGATKDPLEMQIDQMLNPYLEGCTKVGDKVKEELVGIRNNQDGIKQMMDSVASGIVAKNEENVKSRKLARSKSDGSVISEEFEAFAFGEDDAEEIDGDDSDWSPDTPARKKLKTGVSGAEVAKLHQESPKVDAPPAAKQR
jgi:kinesin family protein 4/21/27